MLEKLRADIIKELAALDEIDENLFGVLGEDLSTTKKTGAWKQELAAELTAVKEKKEAVKAKKKVIKQWQDMEQRRSALKKELQEHDASYTNIRSELEIHFEAIGIAAFELYQRSPSSFDDTAELLEDMQALDSGIKEKEIELQQLSSEGKPGSFLSKTLRKGKGMVIRGSLKTREMQRGKRLRLVGEHICESATLVGLPENSTLVDLLAPLSQATAELQVAKRRMAEARQEADTIDEKRIELERGARMRNPVKNLEHESRRLETELADLCRNLGQKYIAMAKSDEPLTERITKTIGQLNANADERKEYEKLLVRVDAAEAVATLNAENEKLADEQKNLSERIDVLEESRSRLRLEIEKKEKARGNMETLRLPEKK